MATRKLPKGATTKRPSSRGYASNRAVIENLVAPEKVPANNPSTMSGNRDVQRQAFAQQKTGISKNYKMVGGKLTEISEDEWKQAAKKFADAEKKIPKGTSLNQGKAVKLAKMDAIKQAVAKVQGVKNIGSDTLTAAERKMAREGVAPPRAPSGAGATKAPVTPATAPKAPAVAKTTKVTTASTAPKMTRAERSAANKAAHAVNRAAEQAKWDAQKAAKTGKVPAAKPTVAKPAAPAKTTTAKPATSKPAAAKPATVKPAVSATPKPAPKSWFAKNLPNVSTVLKEGLLSPAGRAAGINVAKNVATGLLSRGNVAVTALTYSPDAGPSLEQWKAENKAREVEGVARAARAGRSGPTSRSRVTNRSQVPAVSKAPAPNKSKPVVVKKTAAPSPSTQDKPTPIANPEKAIADFEAKLRSAGVVSIAGGAGGKAQMVPQPMSVTQLEEEFKKKKGPR